jgi:hypothetical protein
VAVVGMVVAIKVVYSILEAVTAVLFSVVLIEAQVLFLLGFVGQILQHHGWLKFAFS